MHTTPLTEAPASQIANCPASPFLSFCASSYQNISAACCPLVSGEMGLPSFCCPFVELGKATVGTRGFVSLTLMTTMCDRDLRCAAPRDIPTLSGWCFQLGGHRVMCQGAGRSRHTAGAPKAPRVLTASCTNEPQVLRRHAGHRCLTIRGQGRGRWQAARGLPILRAVSRLSPCLALTWEKLKQQSPGLSRAPCFLCSGFLLKMG